MSCVRGARFIACCGSGTYSLAGVRGTPTRAYLSGTNISGTGMRDARLSTIATLRNESKSTGFMWLSIVWSLSLAWLTSFIFYQGARALGY